MSPPKLWTIWITGTLLASVSLSFALPTPDSARESASHYLPGETTHGHYQIELKCGACHDLGGAVRETSCTECHAKELKLARDTHPASKFRDPQKAVLLQRLDATKCVTCHREHVPDQTSRHGLTVPQDYCVSCHEDVEDDRPSHRGFKFDSCSSVGCHNYHDNSALYENFLLKHADEPDVLPEPRTPLLESQRKPEEGRFDPSRALTRASADAPAEYMTDDELIEDWQETIHAKSGVNCMDCHNPAATGVGVPPERSVADSGFFWTNEVSHETCQRCHQHEVAGFLTGLHGMRIDAGLTPLSPAMARLPMKHDSLHRSLNCNSCHTGHRFDARLASVDACLQCHDDEHSQEYTGSKHYQLWLKEIVGDAPAGSGVSCATCHMPRLPGEDAGIGFGEEIRVVHNQSWNLAPVEKMVRSVCLSCHGLEFTLDALADTALKDRCYEGAPERHHKSLDMAESWFERKLKQKNQPSPKTVD